jgi:hypothetical protein
MRTTLDLPDPLFREVKSRAAQQGVKLKDLLARYIEAGLRSSSAQSIPVSPRGKRKPLPVAIPRVEGVPPHPAMTNAELHAIMQAEDVAEYHRVIESSTLAE